MFVVAKKKEGIKWPVHINVPCAGGAVKTHKIFVYFVALDNDKIDELTDEGNFALFREAIDPNKGWEGVAQGSDIENQEPEVIPYSEEALEEILQTGYIAAGFVESYFNFIAGVSSKNSKKRRRTG